MFAVLEPVPGGTDFKSRLRRCFQAPTVQVQQVPLPGVFSFVRILAETVDGAIPWERVAAAVWALRLELLPPRALTPDPAFGIRVFSPRTLPTLLLLGSAVSTLRQLSLDPLRTSVAVIDPAGDLAPRIAALAPLAASLRVVTDHPERYAASAQTLLASFGVTLPLTRRADALIAQSTAIIAAAAASVPREFGGLLLTNDRRRFLNATVLVSDGVTLPPPYDALCPPDVDPLTFAAALYELCGVRRLETLTFDRMIPIQSAEA